MDRRDAVRVLGATLAPAAFAASPDRLFALAREAHRRAARRQGGVFTEPQRRAVAALAELILPATDTPGAAAAGVPAFIEVMVGQWYHADERAAFLRGLQDLDERSQADFGKPFADLDAPGQTALLTGMDAEARAMPAGAPRHFFARLKDLTLLGYYTSEIGVTQELGDVFMPGRYDGDVPLVTTRPLPPRGP